METHVLEGTWEEITQQHAAELAGRRLRVIIMPEESRPGNGQEAPSVEHFYFTATNEEFERAFDAIGEGNEGLPILPPEAFERESIYEDVP